MDDICTIDDIGVSLTGEDAPPFVDAINEYLKCFAKPIEGGKCLKCGTALGGLLGSFSWGLVHGEGGCRKCRWPGRALHYIKKDGEDIFTGPIQYILQYHPSFVDAPVEELSVENEAS